MSFQGVEFTPEMREMVVNVKVFFDDFKLSLDKRAPPATKLTASAIGVIAPSKARCILQGASPCRGHCSNAMS